MQCWHLTHSAASTRDPGGCSSHPNTAAARAAAAVAKAAAAVGGGEGKIGCIVPCRTHRSQQFGHRQRLRRLALPCLHVHRSVRPHRQRRPQRVGRLQNRVAAGRQAGWCAEQVGANQPCCLGISAVGVHRASRSMLVQGAMLEGWLHLHRTFLFERAGAPAWGRC